MVLSSVIFWDLIAGSQTIADVCFHVIADDRRTFSRSAIRDRLRTYGNQPLLTCISEHNCRKCYFFRHWEFWKFDSVCLSRRAPYVREVFFWLEMEKEIYLQ